jgi:iron complex outermembrane receptor protein
VFWDAQDVALDQLERVEIICGPGAAIWGANAVNGVINIISKNAGKTQGATATASGGTLEHGAGEVRYGGPMGSHGAYRVFADGFEMGHFLTPDHQNGQDDWRLFHGGFRVDADVSGKDSVTIEGEALRGNAGEMDATIVSLSPPVNAILDLRNIFSEWSVQARWKRVPSSHSETSLQVYFDRSDRGNGTYGIGLNTVDLDFQHHVSWGSRQDLVWGLGYRNNSDNTAATLRVSFSPHDLSTQIFSAFVQDEIAVRANRLYLSLGTRLEHEYYNGFNLQPTARIRWSPDDRDMLWAAISGAQSTPSRVQTAVRINYAAYPGPDGLPILISLFGNPNLKNERLTATEAGFRKQFSTVLSLEASAFFNQYRDLTSEQSGPPVPEADPPPEHLLMPTYLGSQLRGEAHGLEAFANVRLATRWTLSPGYTFLTAHLHANAGSTDLTTGPETEGGSPEQQAELRSQVNLPRHWEWTTSAYFVGRLIAPHIPSYTRLDTNLAWQLSEKLSLSLVGQNLLENLHQEYAGPDLTVLPSLVRRSAYARLTWRY